MKSRINEPCYILLGSMFFFAGISFLSSKVEPLKQYDFLADVKKDSIQNKHERIGNIKKSAENKTQSKSQDLKINTELTHFYNCLDSIKIKKNKIRIAHFGDSMIEGDLITSTLRQLFQQEFGGSGVGFINATPFNAYFRQSINQDFSKNLKSYSIKDKQSNYTIGLSNYTSVSQGDTWMSLKSIHAGDNVKVYYENNSTNESVSIEIDNLKNNLITTGNLQELTKKTTKNTVNIICHSSTAFPIYGLSVESDTGVIIDNFSFRGSSGTLFKELNSDLLKQFQEYLHYDLIILQYGINVAGAKTTDYSWYEKNMNTNINYLKKIFPNTSFLLIGCGDRAVKYKGKYETSKGIEPLIETQKKISKNTHCEFLNFYKSMGGDNSMIKWVTGDTCFANKDYTHFNHKGAEKAGKIIYNEIINNYKNWKKTHEIIF